MELAGKHSRGSDLRRISKLSTRLVKFPPLMRVATASIALLLATSADAVGLGTLQLLSALGQPLHAEVGLVSAIDSDLDNRCYKVRLNSLDGASLGNVIVNLNDDNSTPTIAITTRQTINEPAIALSVEYTCGSRSRRDYQILLDLLPVSPAVVEVQQGTATTVATGKHPAEAVVQSSVGTTMADANPAAKKAGRRHAVTEVKSSEYAPTQPANESTEARHRKSSTKAFRNVLRLGSDDSVDHVLNDTVGMHLTLSRSLFGSTAAPEAEPAASVAPATPETPATSVGTETPPAAEGGARPSDAAMQELQAKIRVLQAETDELRKLNAKHLAALESAQTNKIVGNPLYYLYFMLFASFVAIAWLIWRTRQIQSEISHSSWDQIVPEPDVTNESDDFNADNETGAQRFDRQPDAEFAAGPTPASAGATEIAEAQSVAASSPPLSTAAAPVAEQADAEYKYHAHTRSTLPNAEEILDEIQQAEFWMDMQQPQRAIEILESNWGGERPNSPLPWLYLFDLYQMVGDREKYEELTERFEQIFNGKVEPWGDGEKVGHSRSLEEFPFLMKKIIQLWSTEEAVPFLENLLIDDRDGRRHGFDLAAYRDILFLTNIAYEIQNSKNFARAPQNAPEWSVNN